MSGHIVFSKENGVARIVLNRKEKKNAITVEMMAEMIKLIEGLQWEQPDSLRFLVIEGEGGFFCSGADLSDMERQGEAGTDRNQGDAMLLAKLFRNLAGFPYPVVAKVRGGALAGAMGILACADIVVSEEGAVFGTPEVKVGLLPAVISIYIQRKISLSWLSFMSLSGKIFSAGEAKAMGLVNQVFPKETFEAEAAALEDELLRSGPEAMRRMKKLILRNSSLPIRPAEEFAALQIAEARASAEGLEGLKARKEKREPAWAVSRGENGD